MLIHLHLASFLSCEYRLLVSVYANHRADSGRQPINRRVTTATTTVPPCNLVEQEQDRKALQVSAQLASVVSRTSVPKHGA